MEICGSQQIRRLRLAISFGRMSTVAANALSGMTAATHRFGAAAGSIASGKSRDIAADVVEVLSAQRDFEANLLVLRVDIAMSERLFDLIA